MSVKSNNRLSVLDSIRGLLLVQMTLDHLGLPFNYWLYQCFGFFTAAEGFFFLSGLVGAWAVQRKIDKDPGAHFLRKRARTLWLAQILPVFAFAAFVIAGGISPPYGFEAFTSNPVLAPVLTLLLLHTPGWFDVLSLYAFLLLAGSWLLPRMARGSWTPLVASFLLWSAAQFGLRAWTRQVLPDWSAAGTFDPFAWQFTYFLGAGAAVLLPRLRSRLQPSVIRAICYTAILFAAFGLAWSRQWLSLPAPEEFWVSRSQLGPLRLLNFLSFTALVACWIRHWPNTLDFRATALLGRQSLPVFVWQSLLVQFWFLAPAFWHQSPWNAVGSLIALSTIWIPAAWSASAYGPIYFWTKGPLLRAPRT